MNDTSGGSLSPEDPVDAVLAEYLQAAEAGHPPDQKEFVARYPQFAGELREFFANQEQFERAGKPFRFDAAATQGPSSQDGSSSSPRSGLRRPSPSGGVAATGAAQQSGSGCGISASTNCWTRSPAAGWAWCSRPARCGSTASSR